MNILYDYTIFLHQNLGGISRYFVNLEIALRVNHNTQILAPLHRNIFLKEYNKNKLNKYFKKFPKYTGKIINFYNQLLTTSVTRKFKPEIYHKTYYNDFWPKKFKGKKILTVYDLIHEIYHLDYGFKKNYRPKKNCLINADKIISISENTKRDLINIYNIPKEKIEVVHLATNLDQVTTSKKKIVQEPYILFVGDRKRYKNFNNLVKAYKMNNKIYDDFKLVVFGGEEFSKTEIENFKDVKLDLSKIVKCSGDDQILANLYENAELFVFPSKYEGFGLPLLEASAKNCPIACSNINVFKEVMANNVGYFNPDYPEDISKTMEDIIYSREKKELLMQKALSKCKEYSWDKCAKQTINVYRLN